MIFSLELIQAKQGDCLILHYGTIEEPKLVLIDGGPGRYYNTYKNSLKPRLEEIKEALSPDDPLPVSMAMISHMDDDHAAGMLKMLEDIESDLDDSIAPVVQIDKIWFNAFDDIIGNTEVPEVASLKSGANVADISTQIPGLSDIDEHIGAVIASTRQGREIRNLAEKLSISVNDPFTPIDTNKPPLVRADIDTPPVDLNDHVRITVIHPNEERLNEMQEKWDKDLKKALEKGDNDIIFASIASRDKSPFNLASIVCLIECEGKSVLLTGDAREDDILDGLKKNKLLDDDGNINVDILKMPHHGSDRNVSSEFFKKVRAKHYVISADGSHHNPDKATLVMLSSATEGNDDFTIHMTNKTGKHEIEEMLDEFIEEEKAKGRTYNFEFREEDNLSKTINPIRNYKLLV